MTLFSGNDSFKVFGELAGSNQSAISTRNQKKEKRETEKLFFSFFFFQFFFSVFFSFPPFFNKRFLHVSRVARRKNFIFFSF